MAAPTITNIKYENNIVTLNFSEAVYNTNGGSGALEASDFALTYTDNADTGSSAAAITAISKITNAALTGGETSIRLHLTTTGIPIGARCTVRAASAKNDTLTIAGAVNYRIIRINLTTNTSDNLSVTKDDKEYLITIALANATASKNTAANIQSAIRGLGSIGKIYYGDELSLTGITCTAGGNWDTAAIATGELVPLMLGGLATFEIKAVANSIYNAAGEAMADTETTGVYNLHPFRFIYVSKTGNDSNSGLVATLPKLTLGGGNGATASGNNYITWGVGTYTENVNASSTTNRLYFVGDNTDYFTYSNGGVAGTCRYTMSSFSNRGDAYVELRNFTWRNTSGYSHKIGTSTVIQAWGTYMKSVVFEEISTGGIYYAATNPNGGLTRLIDCSIVNTGNFILDLGRDAGEYVLCYVTDCDFFTNNTGFFGGNNNGNYCWVRNSKIRVSSSGIYNSATQWQLNDFEWNTSIKIVSGQIFYSDATKLGTHTLYRNLTNVSTTRDYFNFWNSTAACTYITGYKAKYNTNTAMYRLQENSKIHINGINNDNTKYLMVPTGIFIQDGGSYNSKAILNYLCSVANTTGIYRHWIKLNVSNSKNYTLNYDFRFNFTTATAKTVKIEIVKGQDLVESTPIATNDLLASNYTNNTWYENGTLSFSTDDTNDEYYLSIKLPTAVGANNIFSFVNKGII